MATVYSNTRHPEFVKWSCAAGIIISIICWVLYFIVNDESWGKIVLYLLGYSLLYAGTFFGSYLLFRVIVDEENDTIVESQNKKWPLKISRLATITYKENKKGKFRALLIHDDGVGFKSIRTSKENADLIVAQLLKANPGIQVKHARYI